MENGVNCKANKFKAYYKNKSKIEILHTIVDDGSTNKESLKYLEKINYYNDKFGHSLVFFVHSERQTE